MAPPLVIAIGIDLPRMQEGDAQRAAAAFGLTGSAPRLVAEARLQAAVAAFSATPATARIRIGQQDADAGRRDEEASQFAQPVTTSCFGLRQEVEPERRRSNSFDCEFLR